MMKLRALAFSFVVALTQVLPASFDRAFAAVPAPAPAPAATPAPAPSSNAPANRGTGNFGPSSSEDVCRAIPLAATNIPPSLNPPQEWRDKHVSLYVNLRQDGSVADAHMLHPSGSDSLDKAATERVVQSWRWAPLACNRTTANAVANVGVPRMTCRANGFFPVPSLALAQESRSISISADFLVEPDGRIRDLHISDSSGDAALDAAYLAHAQENWRAWPLGEGCAADRHHIHYRFPEKSCIPQPVMESRTLPAVEPQGRARAVDLQVGLDEDGKVMFTNLIQGSGDGALDAATLAHVKDAWRWQPVTCQRTQVYRLGTALPVMDYVHLVFPAREQSASR